MEDFFLPTFVPRTLAEIPAQPDEVASLVYREDEYNKMVRAPDVFWPSAPGLGGPAPPPFLKGALDENLKLP
jgi:hypothetical protein